MAMQIGTDEIEFATMYSAAKRLAIDNAERVWWISVALWVIRCRGSARSVLSSKGKLVLEDLY
jgi:hypothetical protein